MHFRDGDGRRIASNSSGGNLTLYGSSFLNNGGSGVLVLTHSTLRAAAFGNAFQGNASDGITVQGASEAIVGASNSINNNGGAGVSIGDLSFVLFRAPANITGNHGVFDVVCQPQFSATRGARVNISGGSTNCVEP